MCDELPEDWAAALAAVVGVHNGSSVEEKRAALACVEVVEQTLVQRGNGMDPFLICLASEMISPLASLVRLDLRKGSSNRTPTRLTLTAFNGLMTVVHRACVVVCGHGQMEQMKETKEMKLVMERGMSEVVECIRVYGQWQRVMGRGFLSAAASGLAEDVAMMKEEEHLQLCIVTLFTCVDAFRDGTDWFQSEHAAVEEIAKSLKEVHAALQMVGRDLEGDGKEKEKAALVALTHLRRLSIVCGRMIDMDEVGQAKTFAASAIVEASSLGLRVKDISVQRLAARLIRASLASDGGSLDGNIDILASLQTLLAEDDGIAAAAAEVLAESVVAFPDKILPDIFGHLSSSNAVRRKNGIMVLRGVLRAGGSLQDAARNQVMDGLLERLGDKRLDLREETVHALAMDPAAIPKICRLVLSKERGEQALAQRSAAADCLTLCLQQSEKGCLQMVLEAIVSNDVETVDLLIKCVVQCLDGLDDNGRKTIISHLVEHFYIHNQSPAIVALLRKSAGVIGRAGLGRWVVDELVLPRMQEEPEAEGSEGDSVLFQRMSPLLVLKVLDEDTFEECSADCTLVSILYQRAVGADEFKPVKQVASEVLGKFNLSSVVWPFVTQVLGSFHRQEVLRLPADLCVEPTIEMAKTGVYICCSAVGRTSFSSVSAIPKPVILAILQTLSDGPPDQGLQQGCMQCLSLLIIQSRSHWKAAPHLVQVVEAEAQDDQSLDQYIHMESFLNDVVSMAGEGRYEDIQLNARARVSMLNALTMAFRNMQCEGLVDAFHAAPELLRRLVERTTGDEPVVHASAMQAAFTLWFKAEEFRRREGVELGVGVDEMSRVHQVCLHVLQKESLGVVKAGAIKLLGLLLSIPNYNYPHVTLAQTLSKLQSVANIDQDEVCRKLAQNILQHATHT